jgi:hypothetical protein
MIAGFLGGLRNFVSHRSGALCAFRAGGQSQDYCHPQPLNRLPAKEYLKNTFAREFLTIDDEYLGKTFTLIAERSIFC